MGIDFLIYYSSAPFASEHVPNICLSLVLATLEPSLTTGLDASVA